MSSHEYVITASPRQDVGKGASRRLRHAGMVPAVLYGGDRDPVSLVVDHNFIFHAASEEAFHSSVLDLHMEDGRTQKVILRDIQVHPVKPLVMHLDFQRVNEDEKIRLTVPLHFANEDTSPAGKQGGVVISHQLTEIEIEALPKDLPEFVEVDLGEIDAGGTVMLSEVELPEGVTIYALTHGEEHDTPVASASYVGSQESVSEDEDEDGDEEEDVAE